MTDENEATRDEKILGRVRHIFATFWAILVVLGILGISIALVEPGWRHSLDWIWTSLFLIWAVVALSQTTRMTRIKRRAAGLCTGCGYDLRASKDRCPECGRAIEKS